MIRRLIALLSISFIMFGCFGSNNSKPSNGSVNAQAVFQEFWGIVDRYYPLLHRKNINWQKVYDENYTMLNNGTTQDQLNAVIHNIIRNILKDGHTFAKFEQEEFDYQIPMTEERSRIELMLENTNELISYHGDSVHNTFISYGFLKDSRNIGYINSRTFQPKEESDREFIKYQQEVDRALEKLKNADGIIVDIRTNGGGQGPFAYYLAGRFATDVPQEVVRQRYKLTKGHSPSSLSDWVTMPFDGFEDERVDGGRVASITGELSQVNASGAFQYANKVAILTSSSTASAAELFTAAMKTQKHVRSFGDQTFGIFAGSEAFTLNSNKKWLFNLSVQDVEIKYQGKFQSFEGIGIPPDRTLYPTLKQIESGQDIHINAAVNHIKGS